VPYEAGIENAKGLGARLLTFEDRKHFGTGVDEVLPELIADCERVKVVLILYQDPATKAPTTYVSERINVGKGNQRHTTRGNWSI
jgi:hypothetical protein